MLAKVAVDEQSRKMFEREIETMRGLHHPNIVQLIDHGSAGSNFYFAMEFCPRGCVASLLRQKGRKLTLAEVGPIAVQILEGLTFAHEKGMVHRDIKPANILLGEPKDEQAKIADFGLAKEFEKAGFSGMTATGDVAGTPVFMAREQITNFKYAKPVTDIWSVAATLYFMLTYEAPRDFRRDCDPMEVILRGEVVPIRNRDSSISQKVAEVIDQALKDDVKERYQTAADFRSALLNTL